MDVSPNWSIRMRSGTFYMEPIRPTTVLVDVELALGYTTQLWTGWWTQHWVILLHSGLAVGMSWLDWLSFLTLAPFLASFSRRSGAKSWLFGGGVERVGSELKLCFVSDNSSVNSKK